MNRSLPLILLFGVILLGAARGDDYIRISEQDITVIVGDRVTIEVQLLRDVPAGSVLKLSVNHEDLVKTDDTIDIDPGVYKWNVNITGLEAGHAVLTIDLIVPDEKDPVGTDYVRITLQHSEAVYHISAVIGWIYFVAWSVSFYPQIYINFKRKSVVGLNFDFLALNVVGFILYGLFNCGLYWITEVENEYFRRYPKGLNPVQINDIVFALHATFATTLTITQCFIYERANQKVSWVARGILSIFAIFLLISVILASTEIIDWLDFLYYCSYVKLCITLIKYIPQAFMNYRRKSTVGWSIGNIFLDFTGGMFSMLQMILNSYNYNDWESIFGDPTKFGLGLFSVLFDILFIIQHYVLYRSADGADIDIQHCSIGNPLSSSNYSPNCHLLFRERE
ncbi:hypothetical protein L9F63_001814, partial [Diploptera punctata]